MSFAIPIRRALMDIGWSPAGGASLDLNFLGQDQYVYANFLTGSNQAWDNDPASAPNTGKYQSRTKSSQLGNKLFGGLLTYQRSGSAWGYGPDGRLKQFTTNEPRFEFDPVTLKPVGLRIEETRTNQVSNPRMEGFIPGTPGTIPSSWGISTGVMPLQVVGTGIETNGIPYVDIRFFGVATATSGQTISNQAGPTITVGETWTTSVWVKLVAGSFTNTAAFTLRLGSEAGGTIFTPTSTWTRYTNTRTSTSTLANTTLRWNYVDTVTNVDFTIRVGGAQCELGGFATSQILPPVGTPGVTTRNADVLTASTAGWFNPAAGTLVVEATAGQNAPTGMYPVTAQLDDGSTNNRTALYNTAATANVGFDQISSNVNVGNGNVGSFTVGQPFRAAGAWSSGTNALVNGGAISAQASAPKPVGVTTLRIGQGVNAGYWNGFIRRLTYYPRALSSAELIAATEWSADLVANGLLDPSVTFTRSSIGTYFDKNGVMQTAQADCPRLDYDPVTGVFKGLLVEELRTNLITQSNAIITPTNWSGVSGSAVATTAVVGVGSLPAFKVVEDATAATQHYVYPIIPTLTDSTDYVFSVFARAAERTWLQITTTDKASSTLRCWFDLTNGVLGTNSGTGTCFPSIQNYGNGWYRCSVRRNVATGASTPRYRVSTATDDNITVYDGNGTSGIYACAAQLEAGTFASSYIPTTTGTVTRMFDSPVVNSLATQTWWNPAAFTVAYDITTLTVVPVGTQTPWAFDDGTTSNRITGRLPYSSGTTADLLLTVSGTGTAVAGTGTVAANISMKVAAAIAPSDQAQSFAGATPATGTAAIPSGLTTGRIGWRSDGTWQNGWIKRLTVKGRRVSNTELQALSA